MAYVTAQQREIELKPIPSKFAKCGGYLAKIVKRRTIPYPEVLDEILGRNFLNLDRQALHLILSQTFETMINNTLKDGNSRKLSDYFTLQVEVNGRFEAPGEQFDPSKHKLALTLRPLSALRRTPARDGLTVYNRNAGPQVSITRMYSASAPEKKGLVFGDDLVIEGENLFIVPRTLDDEVRVKYFSMHRHGVITGYLHWNDIAVSEDGRRMTLPWDKAVGEFLHAGSNWKLFDPAVNPPVAIMAGIRSRGGEATSKQQLHRARTYFDTWLAKHPDANVHTTMWGSI